MEQSAPLLANLNTLFLKCSIYLITVVNMFHSNSGNNPQQDNPYKFKFSAGNFAKL